MKKIVVTVFMEFIIIILFIGNNVTAKSNLILLEFPKTINNSYANISEGISYDFENEDFIIAKFLDERVMSLVDGYRIFPTVKNLILYDSIKINSSYEDFSDLLIYPLFADSNFIGLAYFKKTSASKNSIIFQKYDLFSQIGLNYLNKNINIKLYSQKSKYDSFDDAIFAVSNNNKPILLSDVTKENYNIPDVNYYDLIYEFNLSKLQPIKSIDLYSYDNNAWHFTSEEEYYIRVNNLYLTYNNGSLLLKEFLSNNTQKFVFHDIGNSTIVIASKIKPNTTLSLFNNNYNQFKLIYQNGSIPTYKLISTISNNEITYDTLTNKLIVSNSSNCTNWELIKIFKTEEICAGESCFEPIYNLYFVINGGTYEKIFFIFYCFYNNFF